ncbi:MAG: histidyl-tRNA synthetase [Paenibacillus sp.]|nr:histidyl-tRNA synthetase [Paenibacillus sp.]
MKTQMKAADRFEAAFVAILGDDELARGEITVKTMATGEQTTVPLNELPAFIRSAKLAQIQ